MGNRNRAEADTDTCLSEALLFATICIIGMPVDVHVRDGSVYSGTFHTASVDKDYGIVLKEAKLTKKGKCDANVANWNVIETLVILSGDLVQVIAKGVLFPADGFMGNVASDDVEVAVVSVPSSEIIVSESEESNKSAIDKRKINENRNNCANDFVPTKTGKEHEGKKILPNHAATATEVEPGKRERINISINISKSEEAFDSAVIGRQIGDNWSQGEQDHHKHKYELQMEKSDDEVQSSSSISNLCLSETKADGEGQKMTKLLPNGVSCDPTLHLLNQTINALKGPLLQEALLQVPFVQVFQLLPMHRLMWPQNHVLVC
ncbi:hypothetical protein GH714_007792 [Hevea brasiliensis]|uniref:Ataxin 2 SM domain-containing protein n=1 Tax=Hevea brasiliensis TaxID=3981 RepID=A0A6A6KCV5_HEVBR|nr:hypothetical protein GH714_007792 [Hevea brasiliensis]